MMHTISLLDTISSARQPTIPYTAHIDYAEVGTPRPAQQLRDLQLLAGRPASLHFTPILQAWQYCGSMHTTCFSTSRQRSSCGAQLEWPGGLSKPVEYSTCSIVDLCSAGDRMSFQHGCQDARMPSILEHGTREHCAWTKIERSITPRLSKDYLGIAHT